MMKHAKKLLLSILALCCVLALSACGGEPESTTANYQVTVVDGMGNPYSSGVIVRFLQNGEQIAMQVVNENGVAAKELDKGNYQVELLFTNDDVSYYYDSEGLALSADKTSLEIVLLQSLSGTKYQISAYSEKAGDIMPYDAYAVTAGSTFVALDSSDRTYFLFTPTEKGTYRFTVGGGDCKVGYYGSVYFVQKYQLGDEQEDGSFTVSISASMIGQGDTGTTTMVIGVDSLDGCDSCTLNIERIGDPEYSVADEPWLTYGATAEIKPYTLPSGASLLNFDLTASSSSVELVFNEKDGSYHLNSANGPQVLVWLGTDTEYIACFKTILDTAGVVKYFYDEDGNFLKRETYSECLLKYIENMDENKGVYPLTKDLMYIIQSAGDQFGWWNMEGSSYIFKAADGSIVPGINPDLAWLVMCCYAA